MYKYERIEKKVSADTERAELVYSNGEKETIYPFMYQPIKLDYNEEGIERVTADGDVCKIIRYTPRFEGKAELVYYSANAKLNREEINILPSKAHGYIEVSKKDSRYFQYSDGTAYVPIGINMAFLGVVEGASGAEFGLSGKFQHIGLRQYERWFRKAAKNSINMVRLWLGHEYFSPDTETAYELDLVKFSKIDEIVKLAKKYGIKLKLTIEQFRNFDYVRIADTGSYSDDVFRKFNKRLYLDGERCESMEEWITEEKWQKAWLYKVNELAKRYLGDTEVFAVELWNEMNSVSCPKDKIIAWNNKHLSVIADMFPNNMVINSLGSFDCDYALDYYNDFCWDKSAFKQVHRYLDQGAKYKICAENPLVFLTDAHKLLATNDIPFLVAETGAVNNCHSGPFKFYVNDDDGIILADCVYTPIFVGGAGCGNMWHWDERYVEFKNLYHMYKPLAELLDGVDMHSEAFTSIDMSTDEAYVLIMKGKNHVLGYVRNKSSNWKALLRDLQEKVNIAELNIELQGIKNAELIKIWEDDTEIKTTVNGLKFKNIGHGVMFKGETV